MYIINKECKELVDGVEKKVLRATHLQLEGLDDVLQVATDLYDFLWLGRDLHSAQEDMFAIVESLKTWSGARNDGLNLAGKNADWYLTQTNEVFNPPEARYLWAEIRKYSGMTPPQYSKYGADTLDYFRLVHQIKTLSDVTYLARTMAKTIRSQIEGLIEIRAHHLRKFGVNPSDILYSYIHTDDKYANFFFVEGKERGSRGRTSAFMPISDLEAILEYNGLDAEDVYPELEKYGFLISVPEVRMEFFRIARSTEISSLYYGLDLTHRPTFSFQNLKEDLEQTFQDTNYIRNLIRLYEILYPIEYVYDWTSKKITEIKDRMLSSTVVNDAGQVVSLGSTFYTGVYAYKETSKRYISYVQMKEVDKNKIAQMGEAVENYIKYNPDYNILDFICRDRGFCSYDSIEKALWEVDRFYPKVHYSNLSDNHI